MLGMATSFVLCTSIYLAEAILHVLFVRRRIIRYMDMVRAYFYDSNILRSVDLIGIYGEIRLPEFNEDCINPCSQIPTCNKV